MSVDRFFLKLEDNDRRRTASEYGQANLIANRDARRARGLKTLDEVIDVRRQAVISTIGNRSLGESEKRATSEDLAKAIVDRVMYQLGSEVVDAVAVYNRIKRPRVSRHGNRRI